jgi:hypothetical protein
MNSYLDKNIIKGVFLLVLAVCGNFVAETLGCKTQKLLSENIFAKHVIVIMIIFFSINLTGNSDIHPNINMAKSLFVWFLFLIFTKMSLNFTVIVFTLIMVVYILDTYIDYYQKKNKDTKLLSSIQNNIYYLIISLIVVGFILYFNKQYKDYKDNWDTVTFLFGKTICESRK